VNVRDLRVPMSFRVSTIAGFFWPNQFFGQAFWTKEFRAVERRAGYRTRMTCRPLCSVRYKTSILCPRSLFREAGQGVRSHGADFSDQFHPFTTASCQKSSPGTSDAPYVLQASHVSPGQNRPSLARVGQFRPSCRSKDRRRSRPGRPDKRIARNIVDLECAAVDVAQHEIGRAGGVDRGDAGVRHFKPIVPMKGSPVS
jgi:hypothetical protein